MSDQPDHCELAPPGRAHTVALRQERRLGAFVVMVAPLPDDLKGSALRVVVLVKLEYLSYHEAL
jgi:hypothetical protein